MAYFVYAGLISFTLAVVSTWLTRRASRRLGIVDRPDLPRKIHKKPIPLLGGVGIFLAFFITLVLFRGHLLAGDLDYAHWIGFLAGGLLLMIGGILDDKYDLNPSQQIIWPVLAVIAVITGGVGIEKVTNPFNGVFYLDLAWLSHLIIFAWLMGMMYTTKLLDGLDGLVAGVTMVGSIVIFLFTLTTDYYQPDIGLAALILAAACLGFLVFNWHPASIFLGDGGSLFLGFALGVLSIISGSKIAIALLVMGLPVLDVAWTILRRIASGKNPFRISDRKHLHFRLLDLGIGYRKTVLLFYALAAAFGVSALFLQSLGKFIALLLLIILMFSLIVILNQIDKRKN
jgi:UDP-GlcNAc:undecaprenyl-phosphate GlcNAc-1-phosphate transferase